MTMEKVRINEGQKFRDLESQDILQRNVSRAFPEIIVKSLSVILGVTE